MQNYTVYDISQALQWGMKPLLDFMYPPYLEQFLMPKLKLVKYRQLPSTLASNEVDAMIRDIRSIKRIEIEELNSQFLISLYCRSLPNPLTTKKHILLESSNGDAAYYPNELGLPSRITNLHILQQEFQSMYYVLQRKSVILHNPYLLDCHALEDQNGHHYYFYEFYPDRVYELPFLSELQQKVYAIPSEELKERFVTEQELSRHCAFNSLLDHNYLKASQEEKEDYCKVYHKKSKFSI